MSKTRLEAFSDGVIAILITIMVLELKFPEGHDWHALREVAPKLALYALSFAFLGIYWSNHHHMLHAARRVNGAVLWANLHLLFWLSLVPVTTAWLGDTDSASIPTACYGVIFVLSAIAYTILQNTLIAAEGPDSMLAKAVSRDVKGKLSIAIYLTAVFVAFWRPWISDALYVVVALIWIVPDRRIEGRVQ